MGPVRGWLPRLHLVTDDRVLRDPAFRERCRRVFEAHGAAVALHVRGHGLAGRELFERVRIAVDDAKAAGSPVLVNDRLDAALAAGAAGVQIGRRSMPVPDARRLLGPEPWIGHSAHSAEEARSAVADGAEFVFVGTVYPSASHPEREAAGPRIIRGAVEALAAAAAARPAAAESPAATDAAGGAATSDAGAPVLAIGGITPERAAEAVDAGAYGVACISGVWHAEDPAAAAARYLAAIR